MEKNIKQIIEDQTNDHIRKEAKSQDRLAAVKQDYWSGPNRYICDVLEEMRKCHETRNYSYIPGLIEELQVISNRMESKISEKYDYYTLRRELIKKVVDEATDLKKN